MNQSPYVINVGSIATLYCRASGKPILTVQWYKDSLAVNPVATLYQQAFLIPTDAPHTTVYTCVGRNNAGGKIHMQSANITVTVKGNLHNTLLANAYYCIVYIFSCCSLLSTS